MGHLKLIFFLICISGFSYASENSDFYSFEKAYSCKDRFKSHVYCVVIKPKDFTKQETDLVLNLISDLKKQAPGFFRLLLKRPKVLKIYRQTNGAVFKNNHSFIKDDFIAGWIEPSSNEIHLTDLFFENTKMINELYNFQHYLMLHELAHILDFKLKKVSHTDDFLNLYSWHLAETGESKFISGVEIKEQRWQTKVSYIEVDELRQKVRDLFDTDQGTKATQTSLEFGQKHGHPTSYSMTNPYENFAELVAHYFLDPQSMRTVPLEVHNWLDALFYERTF